MANSSKEFKDIHINEFVIHPFFRSRNMAANDDDDVGNIQIYILINVTLRGTGMAPVLRKHASISSSEFWEMSQSLLEMNSTGWPR